MTNNSVSADLMTLRDLSERGYGFTVPLYQRLYVWGSEHVRRLMEDLLETFREHSGKHYYMGPIMLYPSKLEPGSTYELIDGQQRFTTLWMLMYILKDENFIRMSGDKLRLSFRAREFADFFFSNPEAGRDKANQQLKPMQNSLDLMEQILNEQQEFPRDAFRDFVYGNVDFLVTEIVQEMDVNRLFELLNNRGVQLQQHEILKAKFLRLFSEEEEKGRYAILWDACSIMDNYIERNIKECATLRWEEIVECKYEEDEVVENVDLDIRQVLGLLKSVHGGHEAVGLLDILNMPSDSDGQIDDMEKNTSDYDTGSVRSIITFPMLLLHVLRVYVYLQPSNKNPPQVKETNLLKLFDDSFFVNSSEDSARQFMGILWKVRVMFDRYIVKWVRREDTDEEDLLVKKIYSRSSDSNKSLYRKAPEREESDEATLLQAMLYHSQQLITHYWLTPLMHKMYKDGFRDETYFLTYLRKLDNAMFCSGNKDDLSTRSFELCDEGKLDGKKNDMKFEVANQLNGSKGVGYASYWFYKLEFILWRNRKSGQFSKVHNTKGWDNYRITAKNSVEHIHPQAIRQETKGEDWGELNGKRKVDNFGNLVLVTSSINSEYSNKSFKEKKGRFEEKVHLDSLKSSLIFEHSQWSYEDSIKHKDEMQGLFNNYIDEISM